VTAAVQTLNRVGIRPRLRRLELSLLLVVGLALVVGWTSYASLLAGQLSVGDMTLLGVFLGIVAVIHVVFVLTGRRTIGSPDPGAGAA
jgi:hypothetical protein